MKNVLAITYVNFINEYAMLGVVDGHSQRVIQRCGTFHRFFSSRWLERVPLIKRLLSLFLYCESPFVKQGCRPMCIWWHKADKMQAIFSSSKYVLPFDLQGKWGGIFTRKSRVTFWPPKSRLSSQTAVWPFLCYSSWARNVEALLQHRPS